MSRHHRAARVARDLSSSLSILESDAKTDPGEAGTDSTVPHRMLQQDKLT